MNSLRHGALTLLAAFLASCGTSVYFVRPPDLRTVASRDSAIAVFASSLRGRTIFIDPGHGGDDRKNKGPAGDVVEADVNLRVSQVLRNFLKQAGANVIMSREGDQSVSLEARIQQANVNNADLFVSIHHNATENITTNYTSTWYHAQPGKPGYQPSSHDLARYIQRDLAFVMGNPGSLASFDGTMSDFILAPGKGLAVLRGAKMPAALVECSFFSSAYEEQRLKRAEFNEIQAWGIFRGIGKYLKAGTPQLVYKSAFAFPIKRPTLEIAANDPSGIDDESIRVYIDGKEEGFSFNAKTGTIRLTPADELTPGFHQLAARVRNTNNNHSFPFSVDFSIGVALASIRVEMLPDELPPDPRAFTLVTATPLDTIARLLPDGVPIRLRTNTGIDTVMQTARGSVQMHVASPGSGAIEITASNGPVVGRGKITVKPGAVYTRGIVMSSNGKPADGATITFPQGKKFVASASGDYVIGGVQFFGVEATVAKQGYFSRREAFSNELVQTPIILTPVARGELFGKSVLIELMNVRGSKILLADRSRIDVQAARRLASLLIASGAECIILDEQAPSASERKKLFVKYPQSIVIRIGADDRRSLISANASDLEGSKQLARKVMSALPQFSGLLLQSGVPVYPQRDETAKMRQMSIFVPTAGPRSYEPRAIASVASGVAWGLYSGILAAEGYSLTGTKKIEVHVVRKNTLEPAAFAEVVLNNSLAAVTDARGNCTFIGVTAPDDDARVVEEDQFDINGVKSEVLR